MTNVMKSFYLAAPFFNEEQRNVCQQIEEKAKAIGLEIFSPRLETLCPPDATPQQRHTAFDGNIKGIIAADFVLARIDDYDPGTIWELGFAYGMQHENDWIDMEKRPVILCFTVKPEGRGLNLMLAQGSDGFIRGVPNVIEVLTRIQDGRPTQGLIETWTKEIV